MYPYPYPAYSNYQFQKNQKKIKNFDQTIENIKNKQYQPTVKTITRTSTKYDENKRQIEIHTDTKTIQTFYNVDNLSLFYNKPVYCKEQNNKSNNKNNNIKGLKKSKNKDVKKDIKNKETYDEEKVNITIKDEEKFDFVVI